MNELIKQYIKQSSKEHLRSVESMEEINILKGQVMYREREEINSKLSQIVTSVA